MYCFRLDLNFKNIYMYELRKVLLLKEQDICIRIEWFDIDERMYQ